MRKQILFIEPVLKPEQSKRKKKKQGKGKLAPLQIRDDAAGIDISPTEMFAAVGPDKDDQPVRRFGPFTEDLNRLADWLIKCKVKTVAMESTGVYWVALFQILEDRKLEVYLVNAHHLKSVPGRKSDVSDCQWIQQLHSLGLLKASFRPPQQVCALRSILRHRSNLTRAASEQIQLMQKSLHQMNVLIHHVLSDITGTTGLLMLDAIIAGNRDPQELAKFRDRRVKASPETIIKALEGDYREEHIFTLRQSLELYRFMEKQMEECDQEIGQRLKEFDSKLEGVGVAEPDSAPSGPISKSQQKKQDRQALSQQHHRILGVDLTQIDGISTGTIQVLLSEVGPDLSRFRNAGAMACWVGLCPNREVSGGKVLRSNTQKKKCRLALALRLAANSLLRSQSALGDCFRRLRTKLGTPKAITAMAHKLLRILYHLITTQVPFDETILQEQQKQHQQRRLKNMERQARSLGFQLLPIQ